MRITFFDFIKRDLMLGIILSALVFACALAMGGPFLTTSQQPAAAASPQVLAQSDASPIQ